MPHTDLSHPPVRRRLTVTGQVQGVGFRPFIYRLALELGLTGGVRNTPEGVVIEIQGLPTAVAAFGRDLRSKLPPLARLVGVAEEDAPPQDGETAFAILASSQGTGHHVLISPDTATCADCLADMAEPQGRRHLYAFTNCTNCGPRYTITRAIPYDRATTSMACFPLCSDCAREYGDPLNRRFHAQPNACPVCGPRLWLTDVAGQRLADGPQAVVETARCLAQGLVCAVKGLGGFHLAVDATNSAAVQTLRQRKRRWGKPLAVMVPDLATARQLAEVSEDEATLLSGAQRPIVLLRKVAHGPLAPDLSPDTDFLGLMLPYAPLQHALFHHYRDMRPELPALVMTSGNASSEPICLGNREALARLGRIADRCLLHDRDILIRTDDSVARVLPATADTPAQTQFFRRARGYTPSPVFLPQAGPSVLGVGPELKATLCLTKGDQAFVSQHLGDMENLETLEFFQEMAAHLPAILQTTPELLVRDLHPDYMSSRWAREQPLPTIALQHHYAHIHAVLAEHRHTAPAVGLALDGTGLGEDGNLWGGEALYVHPATLDHRRLAHFAQLRLPGGEAAIREPWRTAQAGLHALGLREPTGRPWPWLPQQAEASRLVTAMLERGINSPLTSSCGRLFDAVAGLLGLRLTITYEGQAAICLEAAQDMAATGGYECPVRATGDGPLVLDTLALLASVHAAWQAGVAVGTIARRFHLGLTAGLADLAQRLCRETETKVVALSGGVMQNRTLSLELPAALRQRGLTPLVHSQLPPNDACISLGQAAYGQRWLLLGRG